MQFICNILQQKKTIFENMVLKTKSFLVLPTPWQSSGFNTLHIYFVNNLAGRDTILAKLGANFS